MKLSEFHGLDPKVKQLLRSTREGRLMHAIIFDGPAGTGKRSMADIITRAALCESSGERPCDECSACKKCLSGVHRDVHIVDLDGDRKQIRVEQIRELIDSLSLASFEGGKKIVVIEHADAMNPAAQNALLKTLEEPVGDTLFFLLTASPANLLPTIRSRCLSVHFSALSVEDCAAVLTDRGVAPLKAHTCAALAAGCPGRALEIASEEGYFAFRDKVIAAVESIRGTGNVPAAVAAIGRVDDNRAGDELLEILELYAWELMRVQNGADPMVESDKARLRNSRISGNVLLRMIADARRSRNVNVSWTNILEPILFGIADM